MKDICWALAASENGTKDTLIATIKKHLANPAIQNLLKFLGLYFGHRPTATDENAQPPPPHLPPPTHHPDPPLASIPSSRPAPTLYLPPPSFYHSTPMPPLPSMPSQSYRPYLPLQPISHAHSNTYSNIPSTSSSVHHQQLVNKLATLPPSHFYTQ